MNEISSTNMAIEAKGLVKRYGEDVLAVNGVDQVSYQSREKLHHHTIRAPGQTVVDVQVLFPSAEEGFDVSAQLIDGHEFFGGEIEPVTVISVELEAMETFPSVLLISSTI